MVIEALDAFTGKYSRDIKAAARKYLYINVTTLSGVLSSGKQNIQLGTKQHFCRQRLKILPKCCQADSSVCLSLSSSDDPCCTPSSPA